MLKEVIRFEFKYRFNRPATYCYFALIFLLAFAAVSWNGIQFGGDIGKIKQNASSVLFNIAAIFSLLPGMFIASAVMGVPVLRDFEHKMESLIFTSNISKTDYLLGRFIGSFIILIIISTGFIWGTWLGCMMPWVDQTKLLPAGIMQFVKPWLVMIVCNMFVFSCLFFSIGALTRRMLFVYLQSIVLLGLYIVVNSIIGDVENLNKAAIMDPFGIYTIQALTRYWTVAEKNSLILPFTGIVLINRLLWLGIGLAVAVAAFAMFRFRSVYNDIFKKRRSKDEKPAALDTMPIPVVHPVHSLTTWIKQISVLTRLYFKETFRSVPFIGIAIVGLILIGIDAQYASQFYGQELYPVTSLIADFIGDEVILIIIIMMLFYSGELVWKENEIKFNQIYDALPTPSAVPVISKYLGLAAIVLVYVLLLIPIGMLIQLMKGFTQIEPMIYFKSLMLQIYIPMLIYMSLTMFIQNVVSNKFIGYAVSILFYVYILFANQMKIFYNLLIPNSGRVGVYSDMNAFAAGIDRFLVLKTFWLAVGAFLLLVSILFYQRGTDTTMKARFAAARQRFGRPMAISGSIIGAIMLVSAWYFDLNVRVWNTYRNPEETKDLQVRYEKEIKPLYGKTLQPSVVSVKGSVDLFPQKGDLGIDITITYKNLTRTTIPLLLLSEPSDNDIRYSAIDFPPSAKLRQEYKDFKLKVYSLDHPLKPGDSLQLHLAGVRVGRGFTNGGANNSYVANGTFVNNFDFLPTLGYSRNGELGDTDDRKKRGLKEQKGLPARTDTTARQFNLFESRGHTQLDLTLSTDRDQIAICPGYLQKQWTQNDRAYFHYKMDKPIFAFFNIISGRYQVKKEMYHGISLEIYYTHQHPFNLDIMMASMKKGLDYDSANFSPFLYHQMRIIEFPKYRTFAQSFPNTVPFSEGIGFLFRHQPDKLDMCYYVTAHELGHQWWGHQVCEASTVGGQMYSESLAQYSAIMLLKKSLTTEELRRYLKYELDGYLRGRSSERKKENPLDQTDNQGYIHYQKGTLANFAMQDYIGEDNMNRALRKLIQNYGNHDVYPTSDVLTAYIKEVTPDSLKFIVDDLYSKITLFENRVINPTAKKIADGYEVTIPVQTIKYYADSSGNETRTPIRDYIDIGVFTMVDGREKLVYNHREKFDSENRTFKVILKDKPVRAGIDPVYKLIDRNTEDNTAVVNLE